jgi:mono/diheme cytochrome c family protein
MRNFVLGLATPVVILLLAAIFMVGTGRVPIEASQQPSTLEMRIATTALNAAVQRCAASLSNPVKMDDDALMQAMVLYKMSCASCHGAPGDADNVYGRSFYPPAPQFPTQHPRRSEAELYYVIKHGVRNTGMAAWGNLMEEEQVWKVAALLSRLDSLPPAVDAKWKERHD